LVVPNERRATPHGADLSYTVNTAFDVIKVADD